MAETTNLIPWFVHDRFRERLFSGVFEAAAFFVDISGFTPLTETLMRFRKDGAEILATVLTEVFSTPVCEVQNRGGIIPLFAGDAFTALFPFPAQADPEETRRITRDAYDAASAVHGFFAAERDSRLFKTKYGEFRIGVKIGLAVGSIRWGIPHSGTRCAYYFRGSAIDLCAHAEQYARSGEIGAHQSFVDSVGSQCISTVYPDSQCHCITPSLPVTRDRQTPRRSIAKRDLVPFLPEELIHRVVRAEFRDVCPIFISFHKPKNDTELDRFIESAIELSEKYGGFLNQVEFGDKGGMLVVLFGAPICYENSIERGADFLVALQKHRFSIPFRAGMTFGTVWAGMRGGYTRREYGVIGDVVNMSARLAVSGEYGEIRIDEKTARSIDQTYDIQRVGEMVLKGKSSPQTVYTLECRKRYMSGEIFSGSMVGRDDEIHTLQSALSPLFHGASAGVIHIYGEAGIGKSRLVHELRKELASDHVVKWIVCQTDEILRQPLNPFTYAARAFFEQDPEQSASWNRMRFEEIHTSLVASMTDSSLADEMKRMRSFLGALVGVRWEGSLYDRLDPKLRFENVLFAFKNFVKALSSTAPVLILVEDLQWCDDESHELLTVLMRNVQDAPFGIVATSRYRDDGSKPVISVESNVPYHEIVLETLNESQIESLAGQILDGKVSEKLARFIKEKTSGNPFFAEQLLLYQRERGALSRSESGDWINEEEDNEIPSRISTVLISRLDRLTAEVKETIQTAAVLGREFEVSILSTMLRERTRELPAIIRIAEEERIWNLLSEITCIFRHALMSEAAYDMQMRARLRSLHEIAAQAIETLYSEDLSGYFADLVYHYGKSENPSKEKQYAVLAGMQAADRYENQGAIRYLTRALELSGENDLRGKGEVFLSRERVYDVLGLREEQKRDIQALINIAEVLGDERFKARIAIREATYYEAIAEYTDSENAAKNAVTYAESIGSTELRIQGLLRLGVSRWRKGDEKTARPPLQDALALSKSADVPTLRADILRTLGLLEFNSGNFDGASDYYKETLTIYTDERVGEKAGEGASLINLGNIGLFRNDYETAREYYDKALAVFEEIGHRWGLGNVLNNMGLVAENTGEHDMAQNLYLRALAIYREIGARQGESLAIGNLGNISLYRFHYADAIRYYEQALGLRRSINDRQGEGMALTNLAIAYTGMGLFTTAEETFSAARTLTREIGDKRVETYVEVYEGLLNCSMGRPEIALSTCKRAETLADEMKIKDLKRMALTYQGRALAIQGSPDQAFDMYTKAVNLALSEEQIGDSIEATAGLAHVALRLGKQMRAVQAVNTILEFMDNETLDGNNEPLFIRMVCHEVLQAVRDPRATDVLRDAYAELMRIADLLPDPDMRTAYLENIEIHRVIIAKHETQGAT